MNTENTHRFPHGDILVVDDNKSNLKVLTAILTKVGYRVRPASDGESALRSVQAEIPELVLLDYKMPGMNGIEVCQHLKANPRTKDVPVIFLSALGETELKVKALKAGAIDYVTKPFDAPEILVRIDNHLRMHRIQRMLLVQSEHLVAEIEEHKMTAAALSKSEARFRGLFESKMIGNLFWDADGGITDANETFLDMVGYTREELQSGALRYTDITPPEYKEQDDKAMQEITDYGVMIPIEKEYIHKEGGRIPVLVGGASIPGPILSGVAFAVDLSQKTPVSEKKPLLQPHAGLHGK